MIESRLMFIVAAAIAAVAAACATVVVLYWQVGPRRRAAVTGPGPAASGPVVLRWRHVALAALAGIGVVGSAAAAALLRGLGGFGLIHVAYVAIAVALPLVGAALLHMAWRGGALHVPLSLRFFAGLLLAVPFVCAYATFVAPYRLVVESCDVPIGSLSAADQPIRIAVLADIQTNDVGAHEHRAVDLALATQPDLIVLPGDIFQGREPVFRRELPEMRALLARLKAPYGVFACIGNVDNPARSPELFAGTDVRMLFNEVTIIEIRGRRVAIGGVDWKCFSRRAQETYRRLSDADADVRILLCHCPDGAYVVRATDRIDLLIAGHTHGGQVVLPGFGPLMTASAVPREVAAGGLHRLNGQVLYVSRGVGYERGWAPPMRFFCPPEVSLLSLVGAASP